MIETLRTTFHALFFSFIASAIFAPFMIYILYRFNQVAEHKKSKLGGGMGGDNSEYLKIMDAFGSRNGTPNMGGILIWLVVPFTTIFFLPLTPLIEVFLIAFLLFGLWGFLDVLFTNMIKKNPELRAVQERFVVRLSRFLFAVAINSVVFYLLYRTGEVSQIDLLFWSIPFTLITVPIIALIGQFAIYSAEITDGLDGLMIGIFGIIYTAIGAILLIQGEYLFLPVVGIVIGACLVDLYFNTSPARFFNGGPGAMPLGIGAFLICLLTGNLIPYFFISGVTWIIMFSSMIQILSMRFFKKRVFKIAPIHHHFQSLGWPETKVVTRFWLATMLASIIGVYISILL